MLSFFPIPYPDEMLYSVLARYHARSGNASPKITMQDLFGSSTASAVPDLPSHIDSLVRNIPAYWNYDTEDIIYKHTLYPLYAPFLPVIRAGQVLQSMKEDHGGSIHSRAGIMASTIALPRYFRYCPVCVIDDITRYGESYWHRLHQVPGILVCPVHYQGLLDSSVPFHGLNKHEFIPATDKNQSRTAPLLIKSDDSILEHSINLASDVAWVLDNRLQPRNDLNWYRNQYLNLLIKMSLANPNGRVIVRQLTDTFNGFYGSEFLKQVQSLVETKSQNNWLVSIVRKHRKAFDPIRHLLIMRFLCGSAEEFFHSNNIYNPFGEGPWPCLNAAAIHYLNPSVTELKLTLCADTKRPVGTFICECGFVYSRRGPDVNHEDRYRIGRIKAFGAIWENELRRLINTGLSFRETARRLKVDTNTVIKYAKMVTPEKDKTIGDYSREFTEARMLGVEEKLEHYRKSWLNLQENNPGASKTALRNISSRTYSYLYRHDREWLNANSPTINAHRSSKARVNWEERDSKTLEQVKEAVGKELISTSRPERITVSRIGKELGLLALLEKHIDKMPATNAYLNDVLENIDDFKIRRIKWVTDHLLESTGEARPWEISRLAGLKPRDYDLVSKVLTSEWYISEHSDSLSNEWLFH